MRSYGRAALHRLPTTPMKDPSDHLQSDNLWHRSRLPAIRNVATNRRSECSWSFFLKNAFSATATPAAVPGPIVGAGIPGPDLGGRWPSRLVATAAEDRLSFRHNAQVVCDGQPSPTKHSWTTREV